VSSRGRAAIARARRRQARTTTKKVRAVAVYDNGAGYNVAIPAL
jgi:hypothetical protein